jgi:hypothetical protein
VSANAANGSSVTAPTASFFSVFIVSLGQSLLHVPRYPKRAIHHRAAEQRPCRKRCEHESGSEVGQELTSHDAATMNCGIRKRYSEGFRKVSGFFPVSFRYSGLLFR